MVDFAKILRDRREAMTPEQRERADEREALEATFEATAEPISADFENLAAMPLVDKPVATVSAGGRGGFGRPRVPAAALVVTPPAPPRIEQRELRVRIEKHGEGDDVREIIRFIGGPTGHEAYSLDEGFIEALRQSIAGELADQGRWYVCGGTRGYWDACSVSTADLESYLRRQRPGFLPDFVRASPRP